MKLIINDTLVNKLASEGISLADIRVVIEQAENLEQKIINTKKETFTAYRVIGRLTLWVEYKIEATDVIVDSVYYHRIQIEEVTKNG
ncbi:hypothetical protein [Acetobacterium malicum]|uniref:hypothetical protein n=1 Tax=Acetobacterium malicum TaxID=52692 RepID=UPI0004050C88|nr:hypothetical protein [Acetobacterium dehalogenans]